MMSDTLAADLTISPSYERGLSQQYQSVSVNTARSTDPRRTAHDGFGPLFKPAHWSRGPGVNQQSLASEGRGVNPAAFTNAATPPLHLPPKMLGG